MTPFFLLSIMVWAFACSTLYLLVKCEQQKAEIDELELYKNKYNSLMEL